MGLFDVIILILIVVWAVIAWLYMTRAKKQGKSICCGNCAGCSANCAWADKTAKFK